MGSIYKIVCVVNDAFYVGSAVAPKRRRWEHWDALKKKKHHCSALQDAWNAYGEDAFEFEVVEDVPDERLRAVEDAYLAQHAGQPYCFNTAHAASLPPAYLPEVQDKISASLRAKYAMRWAPRLGKKHTSESKAKTSANRKGKAAGPDHYRYGKTVAPEVREKIGATQRGRPKGTGRRISEEGLARIRAAAAAGRYSHWAGRQHTEEAKAKMSRAVIAIAPDGTRVTYPSITALREALQMKAPTVNRALKTGKPLARGPKTGWCFVPAVT